MNDRAPESRVVYGSNNTIVGVILFYIMSDSGTFAFGGTDVNFRPPSRKLSMPPPVPRKENRSLRSPGSHHGRVLLFNISD